MEQKSQQRFMRFELPELLGETNAVISLAMLGHTLRKISGQAHQEQFSASLDWTQKADRLRYLYIQEIMRVAAPWLAIFAEIDPRTPAQVDADQQDSDYAATITDAQM